MNRQLAVGDVMTRNYVAVDAHTSLWECARKMVKQRVSSLLVTRGRTLLGLVTQSDILWAITKKPTLKLKEVQAIDVATKKVAVIKPSATLSEAFQKMKMYGFRRLPVLAHGELVGVLTIKDVLAVDPSIYSQTSELFDLREAEQKIRRAKHEEDWASEGLCEECGAFSDLVRVENRLLCTDCREELY